MEHAFLLSLFLQPSRSLSPLEINRQTNRKICLPEDPLDLLNYHSHSVETRLDDVSKREAEIRLRAKALQIIPNPFISPPARCSRTLLLLCLNIALAP